MRILAAILGVLLSINLSAQHAGKFVIDGDTIVYPYMNILSITKSGVGGQLVTLDPSVRGIFTNPFDTVVARSGNGLVAFRDIQKGVMVAVPPNNIVEIGESTDADLGELAGSDASVSYVKLLRPKERIYTNATVDDLYAQARGTFSILGGYDTLSINYYVRQQIDSISNVINARIDTYATVTYVDTSTLNAVGPLSVGFENSFPLGDGVILVYDFISGVWVGSNILNDLESALDSTYTKLEVDSLNDLRVRYTDTAAMLLPYITIVETRSEINDTANVLRVERNDTLSYYYTSTIVNQTINDSLNVVRSEFLDSIGEVRNELADSIQNVRDDLADTSSTLRALIDAKTDTTEFKALELVYNPNSQPILNKHYDRVSSFEEVNNSAQNISKLLNTNLSSGRNAYQDATLVMSADAYKQDTIFTQKGIDLRYFGAATTRINNQGASEAVGINMPALDFQDQQIPSFKYSSGSSTANSSDSEFDVNAGSFFIEFEAEDTTTSTVFKLTTTISDTTKSADFGSGAVAAYSLERITSGYTGKMIEVTRSSDNATQEFDSTEIADGTLATFVGLGNIGYISKWIDQVDTFDLVQNNINNMPVIYRGDSVVTQDGRPAFWLSADWLRNEYLSTTSNTHSIYLVSNITGISPTSSTIPAIWDSYNRSGERLSLYGTSGSPIDMVVFNGSNAPQIWNDGYQAIVDDDNVSLLSLNSDAANTTLKYNGILEGTVSTLPNFNFNGVSLFDFALVTGATEAEGYVQEFIIYDESITSDLLALENSINDRYNITNNIQPPALDSLEFFKSGDSLYVTVEGVDYAISDFAVDIKHKVALGYDNNDVSVSVDGGQAQEFTTSFTQAYNNYEIRPDSVLWVYQLVLFDFKLLAEELETLTQ